MAIDDINSFIAKHAITMTTRFVPYSQSRTALRHIEEGKTGPRNLNWEVTLYADGRKIWSGDYAAGQGHCPSYVSNPTREQQKLIDAECEHGFECYVGTYDGERGPIAVRAKPIQPRIADVLASLSLDAQAADYPDFDVWAGDYGYSSDSRRAHDIWRKCLDVAVALRSGLGDLAVRELAEASADY